MEITRSTVRKAIPKEEVEGTDQSIWIDPRGRQAYYLVNSEGQEVGAIAFNADVVELLQELIVEMRISNEYHALTHDETIVEDDLEQR